MKDYETKQIAGWCYALAGLLGIVGLAVGVFAAVSGHWEGLAGLGLVVVALILASFAVLRVRVTAADVFWSFGLPIFSRRVPLDDVSAVHVDRSPWYWGWGIRWTPRGWLWRSNGLDAVWLELSSGKQVGVGSSDPERLAREIRDRLSG